ncbi:MAG: methylmalonyl-CoA epimerase [Chloroflexota bacterium]|nr:methylmalonyl-CoA epimerase [Chloroflexota bacterium]
MNASQVCTVDYIDHVGIAVKDIDAALKLFHEVFGAPMAEVKQLDDQGIRGALVQVGQTRLELMEPTSSDTTIGRFIDRRGEGLHHLAFYVTDLPGKIRIVDELGLQLIDREPREGLSGDIAFIHPRSVFGILTELVERPNE